MKKRHHHYIWQKYLRAWSTNAQVWCLMENKIFKSNTKNIGQIKDFYKLKELSKMDINIIYHIAIEQMGPQLQKLNNRWISLYNSFSLLKRAVENYDINDVDLNEKLEEAIFNMEEDLHGKIEIDGIKYIESILNENINFFKTEQGYIQFIYFLCIQYMRTNKIKSDVLANVRHIQSIDFANIWNILSHILATNIGWNLYITRDSYKMFLLKNKSLKEFITADQPVINTQATGLANNEIPKELEFYYPVSPQLAILITKFDYNTTSNEINLKIDEVNKYNLMINEQAHSQIYAASEETLKEFIH